jgi:UPF0716 protein FxsA
MFLKLFFLFALIPIMELYLLLKIGAIIGPLNTVIIILITAGIGSFLAKQEGFKIIKKINMNLREGKPPTRELLNGLFILIGGFLLLTPGFLTDIAGLTMLIPPVRNIYCNLAEKYIKKKFEIGQWDENTF